MKTKISRPIIRATTKLSSWLRACKINHEVQDDYTVIVRDSMGVPRSLNIGINDGDILFRDFWTTKTHVALKTFADLTESLGYGRQDPLKGRKNDQRELDYIDYWMRHTEVKNSPNPPEQVFKDYSAIINSHVNRFCSNKDNRRLMWEVGLEEGDIHSIALAWIVSYECLHKMVISKQFDNEKILQSYLKQRFGELHNRLANRAKKHGYQIMDPLDFSNKLNELTYFQDPLQNETEDLSGRAKYNKAHSELTKRLNQLPKEVAKTKINSVINDPNSPLDVVKKAKAWLQEIDDSVGV